MLGIVCCRMNSLIGRRCCAVDGKSVVSPKGSQIQSVHPASAVVRRCGNPLYVLLQVCAVLTLMALGLRAYGMGSIAALGNDRDTVERLLARE